ncbi:MAG: hypothetical protein QOH21_376 [Acidobacteriota bacterium]|jgi:hypothetical protein|nr:hypothetical protein [Acidobacteriota bacterium]
MTWFGIAFIAVVGIVILIRRRDLASLQAMVLGGSIRPGCVIAEAILLLAVAAVVAVMHLRGF